MRVALLLLVAFALPALGGEPEKKARLVVNELVALQVTPEEASAMTDAVVAYLNGRELFEVLGPRDVQTLLGAERQKQLAGACGNDGSGCSADMTKLVDARFVLSGQLAKIGSAYQLTLQLVDTSSTKNAGRSSKLAGSLPAIRELVPYAASEATGSPLPPPPSRVLPITFMATGGAALLAGGAVTLLAFSREATVNEELCPNGVQPDGRCGGVNLQPHSYYADIQNQIFVQKMVALGVSIAGAALLAVGAILFPPDDVRTRISVRFVPTGIGGALVGSF